MADTPNPGSREAGEQGCTCPVLDNCRGAGVYEVDGVPQFWINSGCPLHAPPPAADPAPQEAR